MIYHVFNLGNGRIMKKSIILGVLSMLGLASCLQAAGQKPNIVFVLVDDLGWKDLGCFGAKIYETPNIDRLCADGMKFTQAYTTISICSPARASMMTGKHPMKLGMWYGHPSYQEEGCRHPAQLPETGRIPDLACRQVAHGHGRPAYAAGTTRLRRQHRRLPELGAPAATGGPTTNATKGNPDIGVPKEFVKRGKKGDYLTDKLTDEAIGLIEKRDKNKPFFLNFWHYAVHEEWDGKPELVEKYKKKIAAAGLKPTYRL